MAVKRVFMDTFHGARTLSLNRWSCRSRRCLGYPGKELRVG